MKRQCLFGMLLAALLVGMANGVAAITDTMDSGWTSTWTLQESGGDALFGYSSSAYTSPPTSIFAKIWGAGFGADVAGVTVEKTFTWTPGERITRFKLNYMVAQMTDGDAWGGMAAVDEISIITIDSQGSHKYTYVVACGTTNTGDWAYDYCKDQGPNYKYIDWNNQLIAAPGHGELEPPLNTWYALDRDVDADFTVDWSSVTMITIQIEHRAGYLKQDTFETYFDDLELVAVGMQKLINYQGYLTDTGGTPIDGTISMTFSIYDTAAGGTALWSETGSVSVRNGLYSINLGEVAPITLPFDTRYYLGVTVGTDPEMTPRHALTSVAHAFRADKANAALALQCSGCVTLAELSFDPATQAVSAIMASDGSGSGLDADLLDSMDSSAFALAGHSHTWGSLSGIPAGFSDGTDNDILGGLSCSGGQVAKWNATAGQWSCGDDAAPTYSAGTGLTLDGNTFDVRVPLSLLGQSSLAFLAVDDFDVFGNISVGVAGFTWFPWVEVPPPLDSYGVWGIGDYGVVGWGYSYAGYFDGNVHVSGTLTKSAGSFKIDHPLEPDRKYLQHSFVESPDMKNIYDGVAVLDENGDAWVELPRWFEVLNRDFRYQLTAVGAPMPDLHIAEEVSGNRFRIAGGLAGKKASWQVTGIRQDPYANAHRIQVEEDKPSKEVGYYLHPEAYGKPQEKGLGWARNPELLRKMKEAKEKEQQLNRHASKSTSIN